MPTNEQLERLASQVGVETAVIRAWFCNRRTKMRRQKSRRLAPPGILNLSPGEVGAMLPVEEEDNP